jgi:predicted RNase H-like HicB family nuclease
MPRYIALVDGSAGAYGVVVPDLPGCTAMGATVEEALRNAARAVSDWVDVTEQADEAIPPPRPVEALREEAEVAKALSSGATLTSVSLVRQPAPRRL